MSKQEFVSAAKRDSGCSDVIQMLKDDETLIPYLSDLIGEIVKGSDDKRKVKLFKFVKWCVKNAGDVGTTVISTVDATTAGVIDPFSSGDQRNGSSDFLKEINIYLLFKHIVSEYKNKTKERDHYELENILDRCFISIFQVLHTDQLVEEEKVTIATSSSADISAADNVGISQTIAKMLREITEKKIVFAEDVTHLNKRLLELSPITLDLGEDRINVVDISESKVVFDDTTHTQGKIEARIFCYKGIEKNGLIEGSEVYPIVFTVKVNRNQIPFLKGCYERIRNEHDPYQLYDGSKGDVKFLSMLLRYQSINSSDGDRQSSQQWGVPYKVYKEWYALGARYECFASPLNCRLMTFSDQETEESPPRFCSLFGDYEGVDAPFGSIGNFFDVNMLSQGYIISTSGVREIVWCFNPPFIEDLMQKGVEKLIEEMNNVSTSNRHTDKVVSSDNNRQPIALVVIGVLPNWEDAVAHKLVSNSKYTAYKKKLVRRKYEYESETLFVAPFDSLAFVMHSDAPSIATTGITPSLKKFQHALDIWSL